MTAKRDKRCVVYLERRSEMKDDEGRWRWAIQLVSRCRFVGGENRGGGGESWRERARGVPPGPRQ